LAIGADFPHILIEGESALTARLWDSLAVKPLVLSPNVSKSELNPDWADYLRRLQIIPFLHAVTEAAGQTDETVEHLRNILLRTRRRLGLPKGESLRLLVVGSHTSIANQERMGRIQDGENWQLLARQNFFKGLLQERRLAGRLHLALEGFEGITCGWLADAFPALRPTQIAPEFDDLIADARRVLATSRVTTDRLPLKRPAVPLIYTRDKGSQWQPFNSGRTRGPYTTTSKLIEEFRKERAAHPTLEGVLVKVIPEDVEDHNPLDPPMITTVQLIKGRAAGLRAVLLDRSYGIVCLTDTKAPGLPIFAV